MDDAEHEARYKLDLAMKVFESIKPKFEAELAKLNDPFSDGQWLLLREFTKHVWTAAYKEGMKSPPGEWGDDD